MDLGIFETLENLRKRPVRSSEDAANLEEAARILGEFVRLRERAEKLVEPRADRASDLAGRSLHEAARIVLEDAGGPLHARELGSRIKARGWVHPRSKNAHPEQINFQLAARLPRYPATFRRVAPNTFALAKWGLSVPAERPRPRAALFSSDRLSARTIDDSTEPFEEQPWRSS